MSHLSTQERITRLDNGVRMALYAFYQERRVSGDSDEEAQKYAKAVVKEYILKYTAEGRVHHGLEHPVSISSEEVKEQLKTLPSKNLVTKDGINFEQIDSYNMSNDIGLFSKVLSPDNCHAIRYQWGHDSLYALGKDDSEQREYLKPLTGKDAPNLGHFLEQAETDQQILKDLRSTGIAPALIASIFFPDPHHNQQSEKPPAKEITAPERRKSSHHRAKSFSVSQADLAAMQDPGYNQEKFFNGMNNGSAEFASVIYNLAMQKRALGDGKEMRLSEQLGMIAFITGTWPWQENHFGNIKNNLKNVIEDHSTLKDKLSKELAGSDIEREFNSLKDKPKDATITDYFIDKITSMACKGANRDMGGPCDPDPRVLYCGDNNVSPEFVNLDSILGIKDPALRAVKIIANIKSNQPEVGYMHKQACAKLMYHDFDSEFEGLSVEEADTKHTKYFKNALVVTRMHQADLVQAAAEHLYHTKPAINFADFTPDKLQELANIAQRIFPGDLAKLVADGKMTPEVTLEKEADVTKATAEFKAQFTESKSQSADTSKTPAGLQWYETHEDPKKQQEKSTQKENPHQGQELKRRQSATFLATDSKMRTQSS